MSRFPFMPLREVLRHEGEMQRLGVSVVARSPRGFLSAYRNAGAYSKLSADWKTTRENFVKRHLVQYKKNPTYRRWLALVAWAYFPGAAPRSHG